MSRRSALSARFGAGCSRVQYEHLASVRYLCQAAQVSLRCSPSCRPASGRQRRVFIVTSVWSKSLALEAWQSVSKQPNHFRLTWNGSDTQGPLDWSNQADMSFQTSRPAIGNTGGTPSTAPVVLPLQKKLLPHLLPHRHFRGRAESLKRLVCVVSAGGIEPPTY